MPNTPSRRQFLVGSVGAATLVSTSVNAAKNYAASPPAGFTPFSAPGKVVQVKKAGSLQENQLYPKADDAKEMLTKALAELTGEADLVKAVAKFVHKDDKVVVKVNGIALKNMSTNKELVIPFVEAMIASGVPAENITMLEQYFGFFGGTRITQNNLPKGVKIAIHQNKDATMDERSVAGVKTKFVRALTEATAAINFALIKDHSICGYTGALKNMTHGCTINPHDFHAHNASPQIAKLYNEDVIRSRVRLCIADGYKVMAHGGPLDKMPQYRSPHESVYVSTDPVAIDAVGWSVVEKARADKGLKTLTAEKREPTYIQTAAELGLGIADMSKIALKQITV